MIIQGIVHLEVETIQGIGRLEHGNIQEIALLVIMIDTHTIHLGVVDSIRRGKHPFFKTFLKKELTFLDVRIFYQLNFVN